MFLSITCESVNTIEIVDNAKLMVHLEQIEVKELLDTLVEKIPFNQVCSAYGYKMELKIDE